MTLTVPCPICGGEHEFTGLRMKCPGRRRVREAGEPAVAATLANLTRAARRVRWELHFLRDITATEMPPPVREFRFHPTRAWRFDFAWPAYRFAVEVEGLVPRFGKDGSEMRGRHQTIDGATEDLEKYAAAIILGWTVLRVSQSHVKSGVAAQWAERALRTRGAPGEPLLIPAPPDAG